MLTCIIHHSFLTKCSLLHNEKKGKGKGGGGGPLWNPCYDPDTAQALDINCHISTSQEPLQSGR